MPSGDAAQTAFEMATGTPLDDEVFFFRGEGFSATTRLSSGDFVRTAGSKARGKTTATIPRGTINLRKTLLDTGVLQEQDGFLFFANDYRFSSASAAAATVISASANGRIFCKLPDGRTYDDWESGQDDGSNQGSDNVITTAEQQP